MPLPISNHGSSGLPSIKSLWKENWLSLRKPTIPRKWKARQSAVTSRFWMSSVVPLLLANRCRAWGEIETRENGIFVICISTLEEKCDIIFFFNPFWAVVIHFTFSCKVVIWKNVSFEIIKALITYWDNPLLGLYYSTWPIFLFVSMIVCILRFAASTFQVSSPTPHYFVFFYNCQLIHILPNRNISFIQLQTSSS